MAIIIFLPGRLTNSGHLRISFQTIEARLQKALEFASMNHIFTKTIKQMQDQSDAKEKKSLVETVSEAYLKGQDEANPNACPPDRQKLVQDQNEILVPELGRKIWKLLVEEGEVSEQSPVTGINVLTGGHRSFGNMSEALDWAEQQNTAMVYFNCFEPGFWRIANGMSNE